MFGRVGLHGFLGIMELVSQRSDVFNFGVDRVMFATVSVNNMLKKTSRRTHRYPSRIISSNVTVTQPEIKIRFWMKRRKEYDQIYLFLGDLLGHFAWRKGALEARRNCRRRRKVDKETVDVEELTE